MSDRWDADVVVVGAGIGGLTAAAYLQAVGKRCVVVDRHYVVGGNVSTFTHHGYEFDVGTHYVGDCRPGGLMPSVYAGLGLEDRFAWRELDPDGFDRLYFPDAQYAIPRGLDRFRARLHEWFPSEKAGIDGYCTFVADARAGLEALGRGVIDEKAALVFEHRDTTLTQLCDRLGLSSRLRAVLGGQHLVYGVAPSKVSAVLHTMVLNHYIDGAFYPEGGGQVLTDTLADSIRENGGEILLRTPVERVVVEGGRAVGVQIRPPSPDRARGVPTEIRAPVVLSNADLKRTVFELVGQEHFPSDFAARVGAMRMGPPLFVAYVVLDRDLAVEGHSSGNAHVFGETDFETEYAALDRGELVDDPTLFISFSSLKDPTNPRLCKPGQTNFQVMAMVPSEHAFWGLDRGPAAGERYRRNPDYVDRKHALAERLLRQAERAVPGLCGSVAYLETATPPTHERFVRSTGGTSYGFQLTIDQTMERRPAPASPLPGLFFTGAGTTTGHGIAACSLGGVMAAEAISGEPLLAAVRAGERVTGSRRAEAGTTGS